MSSDHGARARTVGGLRHASGLAWACVALGVACAGCSSGSGGSDVGEQARVAPTARPQILNGGATDTFRSGAEVLLTGKGSEDIGGPVIDWRWTQTAGPGVSLIESNSTSVSFTAPDVRERTTLAFELTVEDSTGETGQAPIDVTVLPAHDADRFLSLDVGTEPAFDSFIVVAALAGGAETGAVPPPFTLSVQAYLVYAPRSAPGADCSFDPAEFTAGMPATIASGCRVERLDDLTPEPLPGGGTGISGEWPASVTAPDESDAARVSRWWNPRYTLRVARPDVREFNQQFVASRERHLMLDGYAAHRARIVLDLSLTAPQNQQDATLILTDVTGTPVALPDQVYPKNTATTSEAIANDGAGLPTAAVIPQETVLASIAGRETALTAEVYYRTIDPNGTRSTLNDWLQQAGFAADGNGTLLPEAEAGTGEFAHAVYLNNFDLGFGRRMYARTDEHGNVFSFVRNYTTLESAIRGLDSFVTVVMEYSPLGDHADGTPKFVKFLTYIEDGSGDEPRVASFDFDGRGERFTPGNCTTCHGGAKPPGVSELDFDAACGDPTDAACYAWPAVNRDGESIANGDLSAMFLPWDLESLLYADTDPAIVDAPVPFDGVSLAAELERDHGDHSRQSQTAQLRKLNQAAYDTYDDSARTQSARALLSHWYGGVDADGNLAASAFGDSTALPGWRDGETVPDPADAAATLVNPAGAADLYHDVYARHCRMCHTNMLDPALRFDTYPKFIAQQDVMSRLVFDTGVMPGARLTMDRLWSPFLGGPVPGERLAEHLAAIAGTEPAAAPGAASAAIGGLDQPPNRSDTVYLDGSESAFAGSYAWTLTAPPGSAAALVGATTARPTFTVDRPGRYDVTLTVNAATANEATTTTGRDVVNRPPAASNDLYSLELLVSTELAASVLAGANPDTDPDGDALSVALVPGPGPEHGSIALDPGGTFSYTYTGNVFAPPGPDSFEYEIADGFGGTDRGTATISLIGAPDEVPPSVPLSLSAADASTAAGDASSHAVALSWLASSDNGNVIGYNVYRNGTQLEFVPGSPAPGAPVTHTDSAAEPDASYTYTVTALDVSNESAPSNAAGVTLATSLRRNIQTGWGAGTESLWAVSGCIGCHAGAAGGLTLNGTAADVFTELDADPDDAAPFRLDRANPVASTLLCKPLVEADPDGCSHAGGDFLSATDPAYQMLLRWIEDGALDN